jgi:hypothetical protein
MGVTVMRDTENTSIIHYTFRGHWTHTDCQEAIERMGHILFETRQAPAPSAMFFNLEQSAIPPARVLTMLRALLDTLDDDARTFVIITADPLLNAMVHLVKSFYAHFGVRLLVAPTAHSARLVSTTAAAS